MKTDNESSTSISFSIPLPSPPGKLASNDVQSNKFQYAYYNTTAMKLLRHPKIPIPPTPPNKYDDCPSVTDTTEVSSCASWMSSSKQSQSWSKFSFLESSADADDLTLDTYDFSLTECSGNMTFETGTGTNTTEMIVMPEYAPFNKNGCDEDITRVSELTMEIPKKKCESISNWNCYPPLSESENESEVGTRASNMSIDRRKFQDTVLTIESSQRNECSIDESKTVSSSDLEYTLSSNTDLSLTQSTMENVSHQASRQANLTKYSWDSDSTLSFREGNTDNTNSDSLSFEEEKKDQFNDTETSVETNTCYSDKQLSQLSSTRQSEIVDEDSDEMDFDLRRHQLRNLQKDEIVHQSANMKSEEVEKSLQENSCSGTNDIGRVYTKMPCDVSSIKKPSVQRQPSSAGNPKSENTNDENVHNKKCHESSKLTEIRYTPASSNKTSQKKNLGTVPKSKVFNDIRNRIDSIQRNLNETEESMDEWRKVTPNNGGRVYYYNRRTRESRWKLPPGAKLAERSTRKKKKENDASIIDTGCEETEKTKPNNHTPKCESAENQLHKNIVCSSLKSKRREESPRVKNSSDLKTSSKHMVTSNSSLSPRIYETSEISTSCRDRENTTTEVREKYGSSPRELSFSDANRNTTSGKVREPTPTLIESCDGDNELLENDLQIHTKYYNETQTTSMQASKLKTNIPRFMKNVSYSSRSQVNLHDQSKDHYLHNGTKNLSQDEGSYVEASVISTSLECSNESNGVSNVNLEQSSSDNSRRKYSSSSHTCERAYFNSEREDNDHNNITLHSNMTNLTDSSYDSEYISCQSVDNYKTDTSRENQTIEEDERNTCVYCLYCGTPFEKIFHLETHLWHECNKFNEWVKRSDVNKNHEVLKKVISNAWNGHQKYNDGCSENKIDNSLMQPSETNSSFTSMNITIDSYNSNHTHSIPHNMRSCRQIDEISLDSRRKTAPDNSSVDSYTYNQSFTPKGNSEDYRQTPTSTKSHKVCWQPEAAPTVITSNCPFCQKTYARGEELSRHLLRCRERKERRKSRTQQGGLVNSSKKDRRMQSLIVDGGRHLPGYPKPSTK